MIATSPAIAGDATVDPRGQPPLKLDLRPIVEMTDDQFLAFCRANHPLRFERTAEGEIVVMAPEGGETGSRNAKLTIFLGIWTWADGRGVVFGPSAGFRLPNGATYSPDAAWVRKERLALLAAAQKAAFLPLCPDFVVELRSPSDRLADVQAKMAEYMANGCQLGWLIDPPSRSVFVYRPDAPVVHLPDPATVSGEPLLPGFVLTLQEIWDPGF
jgi:Uma2 family endonuclease